MKLDVVTSEQQWPQSEQGEERGGSMRQVHPCLPAGMVIPCFSPSWASLNGNLAAEER